MLREVLGVPGFNIKKTIRDYLFGLTTGRQQPQSSSSRSGSRRQQQQRNRFSTQNTSRSAAGMSNPNVEVAVFASGCFWGTEHIFLKHYQNKGIIKTAVGYIGGNSDAQNPTYDEVCSGRTGHAEALRIEFDPNVVSYAELVEFFYRTHDPTTLNRQGNDRGTQYRSAIFTFSPEQTEIARRVTAEVQTAHFDHKGERIVTVIQPATNWYPAEEYHQEYLIKNPWGYQCPTHRLQW